MTLDKAIEILTLSQKGTWPTPNSDMDVAIKLGIEALKRLCQLRRRTPYILDRPLPGETKE